MPAEVGFCHVTPAACSARGRCLQTAVSPAFHASLACSSGEAVGGWTLKSLGPISLATSVSTRADDSETVGNRGQVSSAGLAPAAVILVLELAGNDSCHVITHTELFTWKT